MRDVWRESRRERGHCTRTASWPLGGGLGSSDGIMGRAEGNASRFRSTAATGRDGRYDQVQPQDKMLVVRDSQIAHAPVRQVYGFREIAVVTHFGNFKLPCGPRSRLSLKAGANRASILHIC